MVAQEARNPERRHPPLPGADEITRAAEREVGFGDGETVRGSAHDFEAASRQRAHPTANHQQTRRRVGSPTNPPPQLMEL